MHGSTTGHNVDLIAVFEDLIRDFIIGEIRKSLADTREDGIFHSLRLLVDLLHHKMRITVLHSRVHIPVDRHDLWIYLSKVLIHIVYMHLVRSQAHDFIFRHNKILITVGDQCSQIRCNDRACMGIGGHQRTHSADRIY